MNDPIYNAFVEWLCREAPPGTVISDPKWWAPRIYRQIAHAQEEAREPAVNDELTKLAGKEVIEMGDLTDQVLQPCPCGKGVVDLVIGDPEGGSMYVWSTCCKEWSLEFACTYRKSSAEAKALARQVWNAAPRQQSSQPVTKPNADDLDIFWHWWNGLPKELYILQRPEIAAAIKMFAWQAFQAGVKESSQSVTKPSAPQTDKKGD